MIWTHWCLRCSDTTSTMSGISVHTFNIHKMHHDWFLTATQNNTVDSNAWRKTLTDASPLWSGAPTKRTIADQCSDEAESCPHILLLLLSQVTSPSARNRKLQVLFKEPSFKMSLTFICSHEVLIIFQKSVAFYWYYLLHGPVSPLPLQIPHCCISDKWDEWKRHPNAHIIQKLRVWNENFCQYLTLDPWNSREDTIILDRCVYF